MSFLLSALTWVERTGEHLAALLLIRDEALHTLICPCGMGDENFIDTVDTIEEAA
jgi:hypothetical protein